MTLPVPPGRPTALPLAPATGIPRPPQGPALLTPLAQPGFATPAEQYSPFATNTPTQADAPEAHITELGQALLALVSNDASTEIILNSPDEVIEKVRGTRRRVDINFGDVDTYHRVINEFLLPYTDTQDAIDGENIAVEGQLTIPSRRDEPPTLARVHMLCPPLVTCAKVTIAKKARYELTLDKIAETGAMTPGMAEFLKAVARARLTTVISGPTGAGKSTLLQAMTHHFDPTDRVIVVEDTPELRLPLTDTIYLCSTSAKPGRRDEDIVTTEWLVKQANRMRMNRIVVGECRGAELAEWLIAANSGAEGSLTTVHADNPRRALDKLLALATKSPTAGSESTLRREIAATVDIIVQASLLDGRYVVTHIEEVSNTVRDSSGIISTSTLFEFDRTNATHRVKQRPSDDLMSRFQQHGIAPNPGWFR